MGSLRRAQQCNKKMNGMQVANAGFAKGCHHRNLGGPLPAELMGRRSAPCRGESRGTLRSREPSGVASSFG
jgi:hypothetical protein